MAKNEDSTNPSEEEIQYINKSLKNDDLKKKYRAIIQDKVKTRKIYEFSSESHWAGWLRTQGIKWE